MFEITSTLEHKKSYQFIISFLPLRTQGHTEVRIITPTSVYLCVLRGRKFMFQCTRSDFKNTPSRGWGA
jgi:hypothetical protein